MDASPVAGDAVVGPTTTATAETATAPREEPRSPGCSHGCCRGRGLESLPDNLLVVIGLSVAKLCGLKDFARLSMASRRLRSLLVDSKATVDAVIRIRRKLLLDDDDDDRRSRNQPPTHGVGAMPLEQQPQQQQQQQPNRGCWFGFPADVRTLEELRFCESFAGFRPDPFGYSHLLLMEPDEYFASREAGFVPFLRGVLRSFPTATLAVDFLLDSEFSVDDLKFRLSGLFDRPRRDFEIRDWRLPTPRVFDAPGPPENPLAIFMRPAWIAEVYVRLPRRRRPAKTGTRHDEPPPLELPSRPGYYENGAPEDMEEKRIRTMHYFGSP